MTKGYGLKIDSKLFKFNGLFDHVNEHGAIVKHGKFKGHQYHAMGQFAGFSVSDKSHSKNFADSNIGRLEHHALHQGSDYFSFNSMKPIWSKLPNGRSSVSFRGIKNTVGLNALAFDVDVDRLKGEQLLDPMSLGYSFWYWAKKHMPIFNAVVFTGHGFDPYIVFRHQQPVNSPKVLKMWKDAELGVLDYINTYSPAKGLVDTGVHDVARVLRMPGTVNKKPGRVPVRAKVLEADTESHVSFINLYKKYGRAYLNKVNLEHGIKKSAQDLVNNAGGLRTQKLSDFHSYHGYNQFKGMESLQRILLAKHDNRGRRNSSLFIMAALGVHSKLCDQTNPSKMTLDKIDIIDRLRFVNTHEAFPLPDYELNVIIDKVRHSDFDPNDDKDIAKYNFSAKGVCEGAQITLREQVYYGAYLRTARAKKIVRKARDKARYALKKRLRDLINQETQEHKQEREALKAKVYVELRKHGVSYRKCAKNVLENNFKLHHTDYAECLAYRPSNKEINRKARRISRLAKKYKNYVETHTAEEIKGIAQQELKYNLRLQKVYKGRVADRQYRTDVYQKYLDKGIARYQKPMSFMGGVDRISRHLSQTG